MDIIEVGFVTIGMHHQHSPWTLRDLAVSNVSELVQDMCLRIHLSCEHSIQQRMALADQLKCYLVKRIQPLLDEICTYTFSLGSTVALNFAADIILATLMHRKMKELIYPSPVIFKSTVGLDCVFWTTYLTKVPNLVKLDISGVRYDLDSILQVVANNCLKLEIICVVGGSKQGFFHLTQAKRLRVIKNLEPELSFTTIPGRDQPCLRMLLQSLIHLEYIHCCCMGEVLAKWDNERPLALRHCWEKSPNNQRIRAIAKLCPNLRHLQLGHVNIINHSFDASPLTNSSLQLSSLDIIRLDFNTTLEAFLIKKGVYIKALKLLSLEDINIEQIKCIGRHCKNIEDLKIELQHNFGSFSTPQELNLLNINVDEHFFEKLLQFHVEVNGHWEIIAALGYLSHSRDIQLLHFGTMIWLDLPDKADLENVLVDLISKNPLTELQSLTLRGPFKLSPHTVRYLYQLPQLTSLRLELDSDLNDNELV